LKGGSPAFAKINMATITHRRTCGGCPRTLRHHLPRNFRSLCAYPRPFVLPLPPSPLSLHSRIIPLIEMTVTVTAITTCPRNTQRTTKFSLAALPSLNLTIPISTMAAPKWPSSLQRMNGTFNSEPVEHLQGL
jgi:hypothetical protein